MGINKCILPCDDPHGPAYKLQLRKTILISDPHKESERKSTDKIYARVTSKCGKESQVLVIIIIYLANLS